jgi:hypothetical protein
MSFNPYSFGVLISFLEFLIDDGLQEFFPLPVLLLHLLGLSDSIVFHKEQFKFIWRVREDGIPWLSGFKSEIVDVLLGVNFIGSIFIR